MSVEGFDALRAAITIARDHQVRTVKHLRQLLASSGVDEALAYWARWVLPHLSHWNQDSNP